MSAFQKKISLVYSEYLDNSLTFITDYTKKKVKKAFLMKIYKDSDLLTGGIPYLY